MAEFKVIETQEDFDARIKDRIERAEKKAKESFQGWKSPDDLKAIQEAHAEEIKKLNDAHAEELKKYAGYDEKFATQTARIHELEIGALKTKIASEKKLPFDAIEFLNGDDEKTISESADKLQKLSAVNHSAGFTRNTEGVNESGKDSAFRELAQKFAKQ